MITQKQPPLNVKNEALLASLIVGNKDNPKYILTDKKGRKICMGTYGKCDNAWADRLDRNHYTEAGIIWFLHDGHAYRLPGY